MASHHITGQGSSTTGRSRRADRLNSPLSLGHWYLHNSRLFVTCADARDCAASNGGGSLVDFGVTMEGLQCEGSPSNGRSSEARARGEELVANGVTLPDGVDVENRVPRRLTLNSLTRVKPQYFRWSRARKSAGLMMKIPRLSGFPCHDWNRGFRNGTSSWCSLTCVPHPNWRLAWRAFLPPARRLPQPKPRGGS